MVLPDGVREPSETRPGIPPWLILALGTVALAVGALILGGLTASESDGIEAVSVPQDASPPEVGPAWARVQTMSQATAYDILPYKGEVFVFTSSPLDEVEPLRGLQVWRSSDGLEWEPGSGSVIHPSSQVHTVITTALGIVALGSVPWHEAERAWLSVDGSYWITLMDGLPLDSEEFIRLNGENPLERPSDEINDVEKEFGRDARVVSVAAAGEQTIALVSRPPDRGRPYDMGSVEIWTSTH